MEQLGITIGRGRRAARHLTLVASLGVAWIAAAEGCGGSSSTGTGTGGTGGHTTSTTTMSTTTTTTMSTTTTMATTSTMGTGGTTTSTTTGTGGGGAGTTCPTVAKGPTRGSAIALTPDDKTLVTVNRDAGSVTVMSVDYSDGEPKMTEVAELMVGNEPWQVVIDGCGTTAYVVLRKDQKVVEITGIGSAAPAIGKSVSVGSEPTSLALTPHNTSLYVSNWVDGTLSVVDPASMTVKSTVNLNPVIADTGLLGPDVMAAPRPALAHPRGIAITNGGGADDSAETVYVTEWFAVRTKPESPPPSPATPTIALTADTNWKGLLYSVKVGTGAATTIDLPSVANTGFDDAKGNVTGCFPNQVASVSLDGNGFAYVTSTCASPAGPTGVFQKGACGEDAQCTAAVGSTANGAAGSCNGTACKLSCTVDADCGVGSAAGACQAGGVCKGDLANAKTTTHPGLTIVNLSTSVGTTTSLDTTFSTVGSIASGKVSPRMPLLPVDIDFKNISATGGFGYVAAEGADALFRLSIANGVVTQVGSGTMASPPTSDFIDLHTATSETIRLPIGVVTSQDQAFAFVADDGTRDVTAIDLNAQAVAVGSSGTDFRVTSSSPLPAAGSAALNVLNGRRFFVTGLGRWSLNGAAWGSCEGCHVDGLTDNVTWYFARGPRQTTSLDGTFNKADPTDQRILNWTGINDEVADFEGNVRGISGGVGAIVTASAACTVANQAACASGVCDPITLLCTPNIADRINTAGESPPQQGLQGSSADAANPMGASAHPHSANTNWAAITAYVQQIRSPRAVSAGAPNAPSSTDIAAGLATFMGNGNCIGCHSGPKWTYSKVFYAPGDTLNDAFSGPAGASLSLVSWNVAAKLNGFPAALFPSTAANGKTDMRSGAPPGFEQLQCVLRPVGTITANGAVPTGVSPAAVNVLELRQDMVTGGQGAGGINANDFTTGFNVPSLLGMQVGAPYFHAGNARSLEEVFTGGGDPANSIFKGHHTSVIAAVFSPSATDVKQLVAFLLSLDGSTTPIAIPAVSDKGGDICHDP